jgi:hypothetical protein
MFRWVKAPTGAELSALAGRIASRVGRFLERQGLLERDAESASLSELALDDEPMEALLARSITYRIAVGPRSTRRRTKRTGGSFAGNRSIFAARSLSASPGKLSPRSAASRPRNPVHRRPTGTSR